MEFVITPPPPQEVFLEDLDCICGHASAMGNIMKSKTASLI